MPRKDLTDAEYLTVWTIYHNPSDYPGHWVLRGHEVFPGDEVVRPHDTCFVAATLNEVRGKIPAGSYCVGRSPEDHPTICECWFYAEGSGRINQAPTLPGRRARERRLTPPQRAFRLH